MSPQDTANFLATLKLVRQRMGNDFILTADTAVTPFNDESGEPSQDVSEFADVLDYITPMAYSISGGWSEQSGPESPLYSCGQTSGSAASALEAWTAAGFPASKILMGISGLGQAFTTQSSTLTPQIFDGQETLLFQEKSDETPQGDPSLDPTQSSDVNITDICGNSVEPAYS